MLNSPHVQMAESSSKKNIFIFYRLLGQLTKLATSSMKFFRQGLYGLIATPLTRWGWLSTTTPLTADVTVDRHPQEA
jgi:hypothetical protein